ncbi:MAG: hypothetical protein IT336_00155 [Thermomicrobiales bacterium]|nr:hypothetical protein [Thermomicrobiales bacterium]
MVTRSIGRMAICIGLLASALAVASTAAQTPPDCAAATGRVLYLPVDDAGEILPGSVIADPATGATVATLDTPVVERLSPLAASGHAVASTDEGAFLIDAASGTSNPLAVPPDTGVLFVWAQGLRANAGERYTLLSDGREFFMLNVDTGTATDLRGLLPGDATPFPLSPVLAADEATILIWDGFRQWLIPTADPAAIRALTPDDVDSRGGSFSADGATVIYSREVTGQERTRELVIEPVDGSRQPEVIATANLFSGVFIGGTDRIAYVRFAETDGELSAETMLLDRASGEERVLVTGEVQPISLFPSPDGSRLLLEIMDNGGPHYVDIDLTSGAVVTLAAVTGLYQNGPVGNQWLIAMPQPGTATDAPLPGYYAIDLNTGTTSPLAPIVYENDPVVGLPMFSANGRAAIATVFEASAQTLHWFDLASATSAAVRDTPFTGASISPDGCRFAVADRDPANGGAPIVVLDTATPDDLLVLGPGASPIWVAA